MRMLLTAVISVTALVLVAGCPPSRVPERRNGAVTDTVMAEGTVQAFSEENMMLVITRPVGEDTIFYTDQTQFPPEMRDQLLRVGADIRVWYVEIGERKTATRIGPAGQNGVFGGNGNGHGNGNGEDTTETEGTVVAFDEQQRMLVISTAFVQDTIYWTDDTDFPQETREQVLREGARARVRYIEVGDRRVATHIEPADPNGPMLEPDGNRYPTPDQDR